MNPVFVLDLGFVLSTVSLDLPPLNHRFAGDDLVLNLATTPQFLLVNEGNRPVYVPAGTIVPFSGVTTLRCFLGVSNPLEFKNSIKVVCAKFNSLAT